MFDIHHEKSAISAFPNTTIIIMNKSVKKLFLFFVFLQVSTMAMAQVITWSPSFPTVNDSITVYFHADQGDQGLMNYTGDIYAHTGVLTDQSTSSSGWQYVIAAWNVNIPKAKLVKDGTNLYHLTIPDIFNYYGIPTNTTEKVTALAFVFRNADGSVTGRDLGGKDIFMPIYSSGIHVRFVQPALSSMFINEKDTIHVLGVGQIFGSGNLSMQLQVDGNQVATVNNDTLSYDIIGITTGVHEVTLIGSDGGGNTDTTRFDYVINPKIVNNPRPAGLEDGITYNQSDPTTATLSLFAPHKKFTYVIGDFNNWKVNTSYFMNRDSVNADSVYYWITLHNLSPGTQYAFQYLIDGTLRVADPYSNLVLDPNNDKYISSVTYPNMKQYPYGKTEQIAGVLQTAQSTFNWKDQNFQRPAKDKLVIYELLVRDFVASHDYKTLTDTLSYLKRLGINAIELMPVNEFEGNDSWGYNPSFYFAPDKYYGPANDLKNFINTCHEQGIAVLMDIVLNHSFGQSPMVRMYYNSATGKVTPDNPWYNVDSPNPVYYWGYDFNHESKATQYFVDRVTDYWVNNFHFDGYRFDFAKGFTNTPGDGFAYDAARIKIIERMANHLWANNPDTYVILELFTDNSEEKVFSNDGMMMWGNMNYAYNQATMGFSSGWDFSGVSYKNLGWSQPGLVGYMESHDEERIMVKNLQYGNSSGSYNIKDLSTALDRVKEAAAFFFTVPGPKMIWQFGELGYDVSIDYNGRLGTKPIRWDYYNDADRNKLYRVFSDLIKLKEKYPIFSTTNYSLGTSGTIKHIWLNSDTTNVAIVGNFDVISHTGSASFQHVGTWYDYFSGEAVNVASMSQTKNFSPGEFHIYTDTKLPVPDQDLLTGVEQTDGTNASNIPTKFALEQNYPNPFNPTTNINYQLASSVNVKLEVYNLLGQKVATLIDKRQSAGKYTVTFDANKLSSGIYLARMSAGDKVFVKKMILIK